MRIVVTGADGMLGTDICKVMARKHTVHGLSRSDCDVQSKKQTLEVITNLKPDVVIHCAAFTNVDRCEDEIEKAYLVNAEGTHHVALACRETKAVLYYVSTDYIFDGKKSSPYQETDIPAPLSVYGKSKLAGEDCIVALLSRFFILRTSWLFGEHGKNFVTTILGEARAGKDLAVVVDQIGSPTYTADLAKVFGLLLQKTNYGIYHITNDGSCSRYQFASKILALAGLEKKKMLPLNSEQTGRSAKRPPYSVLDSSKISNLLGQRLRLWEEALEEYIHKIVG